MYIIPTYEKISICKFKTVQIKKNFFYGNCAKFVTAQICDCTEDSDLA